MCGVSDNPQTQGRRLVDSDKMRAYQTPHLFAVPIKQWGTMAGTVVSTKSPSLFLLFDFLPFMTEVTSGRLGWPLTSLEVCILARAGSHRRRSAMVDLLNGCIFLTASLNA